MAFAAHAARQRADERRGSRCTSRSSGRACSAGLVIGFVIAIVTVLGTSVWLSRFNIIQAIRDITETPPHRPHARSFYAGLALAAVGLLLTGLGVDRRVVRRARARSGARVRRASGRRWRATSRAARSRRRSAVVVLLVGRRRGADRARAAQQRRRVPVRRAGPDARRRGGGARRRSSRARSATRSGGVAKRSLQVRLGLAYPLARRFRTSMTLGMFALVVFILVYVSVIGSMFAGQLGQFTRDASGGFNVLVVVEPEQPGAVRPRSRASRACARSRRSSRWTSQVVRRARASPSRASGRAPRFDGRFVEHGAPELDDHGAYPSDRAAYAAVLANPNLAIVDKFFLVVGQRPARAAGRDRRPVHGPRPGERRASARSRSPRSAPTTGPNNGVLMSRAAARAAFGDRAVPSRAYVDVADPDQFATSFAARFLANGGQRRDDPQHRARPALRPAAVLRADPRLSRARADRRHRRHRRDHGARRARAAPPGRRAARARASRPRRCGPRSWSSRRSSRSKVS